MAGIRKTTIQNQPAQKSTAPEEGDFTAKFTSDDCFSSWLLLDFTRFAVARLRNYEFSQINVTPEQAAILQILVRRNGKATISEISHAWMRRTHSVSTMAHRMEKQGLINIVKYPRIKTLEVVLTDKGQKLYDKLKRESIEKVYSVLSAKEIQNLSHYLKLLITQARSMLDEIDY